MKRLMSALVALPLLLAFALPVAAVEPSPMPVPIECDAALGCELISEPMMPVDPEPVLYAAPAPCSEEIVTAVAAGSPGAIVEACTLPDGSLLPSNVMTVASPLAGDPDATDYATNYANWLEEFKQSLSACPEGAGPTDMTLVACLLPDGTIAGPVPMFAGAPEQIEDVTSTTAEGSNEVALPVAIAVIALVALSGVFLIRRRRTV